MSTSSYVFAKIAFVSGVGDGRVSLELRVNKAWSLQFPTSLRFSGFTVENNLLFLNSLSNMGSISLDQGQLPPDVQAFAELTYLSQQWHEGTNPPTFAVFMASSEVDQKFLGHFATITRHANSFLSAMLYKILGLSVILSKKLLRARKLRRLDPTRETKSLQLYHHILWLSREGLVMVEQYIIPMVVEYIELKVLAYKLQASFYHIFVLFHNQPTVHHSSGIQSMPPSMSNLHLPFGKTSSPPGFSPPPDRGSITASPPMDASVDGGPVGGSRPQNFPPGLGHLQPPKFAASFILPILDYTPTATAAFTFVSSLADQLLPGSHPIRLSVKLEYSAYIYDCLHDVDASRRLAKRAISDVYNAEEGMDDESFEDAAELVGILGKMVKRGGKTSSLDGSSIEKPRSEGSRSTPNRGAGASPGDAPTTPQRQHLHPHSQQKTPTRPVPASTMTYQAFPRPVMTNAI